MVEAGEGEETALQERRHWEIIDDIDDDIYLYPKYPTYFKTMYIIILK